ncbi:glycoside hydrolase TIM-barrel-like domain-containing protein [Sinirhodobacter sp. WL0062]|uniref:Glycoside hydrolase TIM-barrel-like domain-containing protein n=1 Tax=Rhodobacter flavimaris TaxID=2907145 RepID=A0ABS8YRN2_9RHOB|nr:glycoside hydrolase TIM-barrel-like domain-containing protein [Sinirhodobacter sp. WL0062]MCE5972098.1 glycoside hydrolase TIM-barrel-like domain-containing protein [Sinirhodobacter sp. WL0062]
MATILLSAAGAAIGGAFGGTVLGLSGAVIGRAIGATLGRAVDQRLLGVGSQAVEMGKVDRLRLTSASEGDAVGKLWGRMRVSGQVIWATRFFETKKVKKSGKGAPRVTTMTYSYSVSLALAICEGEILRIGRVWADGVEIDKAALNMRVYSGSENQLPDPKIAAVEGADVAPAYRGIAYVVFEDLALAEYGNRIPQLSFEVVRPAQGAQIEDLPDLVRAVNAVALIPGTGEYALATQPVYCVSRSGGKKSTTVANQNASDSKTDFALALEALDEELPECEAVSLVVSWFGDDLRCGECTLKPKVEKTDGDAKGMPWNVSGVTRAMAAQVPLLDGKPVYGGTPTDASVIEAITALRGAGKSVTFYPFILMDQLADNDLPDPWSDAADQPVLPWRGRVTLAEAPDRPGSVDRSVAAEEQVRAFFGSVEPNDFLRMGSRVLYIGPAEWSMRRFILHYAHLCVAAGGVDAFCIGSEMVALTQIRGAGDSFPAVEELRRLAADVREILGPDCKIGYAADWSEYWGYQPGDGSRYFHLDPLWADDNIDFIGIDNYMPISDWRDGDDHADRAWGSIYNVDYLQANIEGGEGFDWYYASESDRDRQIRTPIRDGAFGEDWTWRYKDIRAWWENPHHERIDGSRAAAPTDWVPRSKPIWFTELGCAAVNKATNQPNKFVDPRSSESALPYYSDGRRDEFIQMQYLRAVLDYWKSPENNPVSEVFEGTMVDTSRAHVWAWDARPYPQFPSNLSLWADGANYARGHWISGRSSAQPLANVVAEICSDAGVQDIDTSKLYGVVRGYVTAGGITGRGALQGLGLAYGFDAVERDGMLAIVMRDGTASAVLTEDDLVEGAGLSGVEATRAPEAELAGRIRLTYVEADGDFETRAVEAVFPDERAGAASATELPIALSRSQALGVSERWLSEARVARDGVRLTVAPSRNDLKTGDVFDLRRGDETRLYRADRIERTEALQIEATRVEVSVYLPSDEVEENTILKPFAALTPVQAVFLDLPLLTGQENPYAPHLAVSAEPWPGEVAVYSAGDDYGYGLNALIDGHAVIGETLSPLSAAQPGVWDRGAPLRIALASGELESADTRRVFNGANLIAIGDGSSTDWELFQFAQATLVERDVWEVSLRLRGQLGTDAIMPAVWPVGSTVVLIDEAPRQIEVLASARNLARHYRIGPASRPYDDPSYEHVVEAFPGIALRPLSPVHLKSSRTANGIAFEWKRRTRLDGDSWEGVDVPLGESAEQYRVRVMVNGAIRREDVTSAPSWVYSEAMQASDEISGDFELLVAQVSEVFGAGAWAQLSVSIS